ncbi:regulator of G protein signaling domain-containing protein, partial [Hysterangium stoloniferum]
LKLTKDFRPYLKDQYFLFSVLIVSLKLTADRNSRKHRDTFTPEEAFLTLASLSCSESKCTSAWGELSLVTKHRKFFISRLMTHWLFQHFMDSRLIEIARDPAAKHFRSHATYVITPKGLHILELFLWEKGINADHLLNVCYSNTMCTKLVHIERCRSNDEMITSQSVVTSLFRRFAGGHPNYCTKQAASRNFMNSYHEIARGIPLMTFHARTDAGRYAAYKYCFFAEAALRWLCDFFSISGRNEAIDIVTQFVRLGLIALISNNTRWRNFMATFGANRTSREVCGQDYLSRRGFVASPKAVYCITEEGSRIASWDKTLIHLPARPTISSDGKSEIGVSKKTDADHLKYILSEPTLRHYFAKFLRLKLCHEYYSFWCHVQRFKAQCCVISTVSEISKLQVQEVRPMGKYATPRTVISTLSKPQEMPSRATEQHLRSLTMTVATIHNTYLAPSSQYELNIDHALRGTTTAHLYKMISNLTGKHSEGYIEVDQTQWLSLPELYSILERYEAIQAHVFQLMATDSVPEFIQTPMYVKLCKRVEEVENASLHTGMDVDKEDEGSTYVTICKGTPNIHIF